MIELPVGCSSLLLFQRQKDMPARRNAPIAEPTPMPAAAPELIPPLPLPIGARVVEAEIVGEFVVAVDIG
jgi:hypothetical protein